MSCIEALAAINMLGALISTSPGKSVAVFESYGKTLLAGPGDALGAGLTLVEIQSRRRVTLRCGTETFQHSFWAGVPVWQEEMVEPESGVVQEEIVDVVSDTQEPW